MASRWLKLWTAAALAVALHTGMGCQARHPSTNSQDRDPAIAYANQPPVGRPISRHRDPDARVFRGSVSSATHQDDLIVR